jgi:hypothetical protein
MLATALVVGTTLEKDAGADEGITSGGRLVGMSEGKRVTSCCGSAAFGGVERGADAFAFALVGAAVIGGSTAGTLRRGAGSGAGASWALMGSGRASARAGLLDDSAAAATGAEMLMFGRATTEGDPLAPAALAETELGPGGALARALVPNEKAESAALAAAAEALSPGGGRLDENAAGSGGAIDPCAGVESNRSLKTS